MKQVIEVLRQLARGNWFRHGNVHRRTFSIDPEEIGSPGACGSLNDHVFAEDIELCGVDHVET
jgi:hypothetical protein